MLFLGMSDGGRGQRRSGLFSPLLLFIFWIMSEVFEPSVEGHFTRRILRQQKADGSIKTREIFEPDEEARHEQAKMLEFMYEAHLLDTTQLGPNTFVDGGVPGSRLIQNVLPHRGNRLFYLVDLENAFPSVDLALLRNRLYHRLPKMYDGVVDFLRDYGTVPGRPGLPQGAITSPYLFNFYLNPMDQELDAFCQEQGITYTRWLDDLSFSYPEESGGLGEKARRTIREIIEHTSRIKVADRKTRLHRLSVAPVTITGVSLYPDGRIQSAPHIIQNASDAFSDVLELVFAGEEMTDNHLALINGHHGALVSTSRQPYPRAIRRQIDRYHTVAGIVHNSIAIQEEPSLAERVESRREDLYAFASSLMQSGRFYTNEVLMDMPEYAVAFPDDPEELHFLMAIIYGPMFRQAVAEQRDKQLGRVQEIARETGVLADEARRRSESAEALQDVLDRYNTRPAEDEIPF